MPSGVVRAELPVFRLHPNTEDGKQNRGYNDHSVKQVMNREDTGTGPRVGVESALLLTSLWLWVGPCTTRDLLPSLDNNNNLPYFIGSW